MDECACSGSEPWLGCVCTPMVVDSALSASPELIEALEKAALAYNAMTVDERRDMRKKQRESFIRAEIDWPEPKFEMKMIDGVLTKVYASYEDYCNG